MPARRTHERVARELLGSSNPTLHFLIDHPSRGELKTNHRVLFHDWGFIKHLERKLGHEAAREALLHIILDIEQYRPTQRKLVPYWKYLTGNS